MTTDPTTPERVLAEARSRSEHRHAGGFPAAAYRRCIFEGCVATWKHYHGGFPGGYTNPDDPEGLPIYFTDPDPEPSAVEALREALEMTPDERLVRRALSIRAETLAGSGVVCGFAECVDPRTADRFPHFTHNPGAGHDPIPTCHPFLATSPAPEVEP